MRRRILGFAAAVAMLTLVTAAPALAGGWAVTSIDDAPGAFTPGETYQLHYTVLQHGQTPVNVEGTAVVLRSTDTGETLTFDGVATKEVGRYAVEVEIPTSGSWEWEVTQGGFQTQELGSLPISGVASDTTPATTLLRLLLPAATLVALALLLVQIREIRRASRRRSPVPRGQTV